MAMPPAPTRLARNESDRRAAAAANARNRKSEYIPTNPSSAPPPLNRASSVPVSTLHSLSGMKPAANSPPLDPSLSSVDGGIVEDRAEDATLRQFVTKHQRAGATDESSAPIKPASLVTTTNNTNASIEKAVQDKEDAEEEEETQDKDGDPITVVHSPISADQWHAQLQKAGQQLEKQSKAKKNAKAEDEAQLASCNTVIARVDRAYCRWSHSTAKHASCQCF